jgi:hypothetical protein
VASSRAGVENGFASIPCTVPAMTDPRYDGHKSIHDDAMADRPARAGA